ncbi:YqeB family protein [Asanoa siamensis]|uniref:DUF308 domain-containing protein n=1 Tax=Asanoa siamensis TaxID=926357 RepID=A0ABQ4CYE0_9ACTN|nr:hypothetical protein [Asanoa siamensis]GIF76309.1 hypothetical protein Asi02nite_58270 [Asanoa siamensis]
MTANESSFDETVVDDPAARVLYWVLFPVLGAGLGWVVQWIAGWVAGLPVAPMKGVFRAIDEAPDPQAALVALGAGFLLGLVVTFLAIADMLVVRVGSGEVTLTRGGNKAKERRMSRGDITGVFFDRKELVVLGRESRELAREKTDLSKKDVEAAFTAKGYPWLAAGDPHRDEFRMWTRLDDDLPGVAHGLLIDRATAIEKGRGEEAAELREQLLKLGVVVRDEKKKQYWRRDRRELA